MKRDKHGEIVYISWPRRIGYAISYLGTGSMAILTTGFFTMYLTDSVGLGAAATGTIFLVGRIFDGVTDIIVGNLIDKTNTKIGRAMPWALISGVGMSVFLVLMFAVPNMSSETAKYWYVAIIYIVMNAGWMTCNTIPFNALQILCTNNKYERVTLGVMMSMMGMLSGILINNTVPLLIAKLGWTGMAITLAIFTILMHGLLFVSMKELKQEAPKAEAKEEKMSYKRSFSILLRNKYYILGLLLFIVGFTYFNLNNAVGLYYCTWYWGDQTMVGTLSLFSFLMMAGLFVSNMIVKKKSIRFVCIWGTIISLIVFAIKYIASINYNLPLFYVMTGLGTFFSAPFIGLLNPWVTEISDYNTFKFGVNMAGAVTSCTSFGTKVGLGIGSALLGFLLEAGGYDGMAATQTPEALNMIQFCMIGLPMVLFVLALILYVFMKVEKENEVYRKELGIVKTAE